MPKLWEERVSLYCAFLIDNGAQSGTIKSYVSGIKHILKTDGYAWDNDKILLETLTRSCRILNDRVKTRLPISENLLELILFEVERIFETQPYLNLTYKTIMSLGYHGLLRVGELVKTNNCNSHAMKACNVHLAGNKKKLLIVLYTSKTHGLESRPQKIRITANPNTTQVNWQRCRHFCPFMLMYNFMLARGGYLEESEPFFIFQSGLPITDKNVWEVLQKSLSQLGLDPKLYGCHSGRIGKASDMLKQGESIFSIKQAGRWWSNAVFRYLRN